MSVYSVQLFAGMVSGAEIIYTAPAAVTIVLRDLELWYNGAATADVGVNILSGPGGYIGALIVVKAMAANSTHQWSGRAVMQPGQELYLAATGYPVGVWLSGYSLAP